MKKITFLIFIFICACAYHDIAPPCSNQFAYDMATGVCKNCQGEIGFNAVNFAEIRKTKNAECIHLFKTEMLLLMGDSVQIPQRLGYNILKNYNFKGSVLDSCNLFFNFIKEADLRGTNLTTLMYGYAEVTGRIDKFTKAPTMGTITIKGDSITCED